MSPASLLLILAVIVAGGLVTMRSLRSAARQMVDVSQYFEDAGVQRPSLPVDEFERRLAEPFLRRVLRTAADRSASGLVERLMPSQYVDGVRLKLVLAGEAGKTTAEQFVAGQAMWGGALAAAAIAFVILGHPSSTAALAACVMLPLVGVALPQARLNRHMAQRQQSILRDLPDTLDLLAISVEAGLGFEAALEVVCRHFDSPLAAEFSLTLREMELGLPRREAFHNLKSRTEVAELSSFILALLQGDVLGIPVGRVLRTQAVEMRNQRRMWAREKAGKLPVKILFPLMVFIFPPIMAVVMGPAALSIGKGFH